MPAVVFLFLRLAAAVFLLGFLGCVLFILLRDLEKSRFPDPAPPADSSAAQRLEPRSPLPSEEVPPHDDEF